MPRHRSPLAQTPVCGFCAQETLAWHGRPAPAWAGPCWPWRATSLHLP